MAETMWNGRKNSETSGKVKKPRHVKVAKTPVELGKRAAFKCQYCEKTFSKESIVLRHMCEQRRRFQQKDTPFARFGYEAFIEIQKHVFGKGKPLEVDFRKSDFYLACLRWGHFVVDIHCLDAKQYLGWLLKMNVGIDQWNQDKIYDCWLASYVFSEHLWDGFERSVKSIAEWGEKSNQPYGDYFRKAGTARILTDVRSGAISGWMVFCSDSGCEWMSNLETGDLELVWDFLDAVRWKLQLSKYPEESVSISEICKNAGL